MSSNNKKHILFLVSSMEAGGAERVAALLCNLWVTEGHSVTLMPTFSGRGECVYPLDPAVQINFLADRISTYNRTVWTRLKRLHALRKFIRQSAPDIVVSFLTPVNVVAIIATMGMNVRVVVSERIHPPLMPLHGFWSYLRRWTYPRAACVVVQTSVTGNWITKNCPGASIQVIPNPIVWPLPVTMPVVVPDNIVLPGRKLLLATGRLDPQKGFDLLLEAFSEIADSFTGWDLVVLGEGAERRSLETLRSDLGLQDCVYFPGQVGNVGAWYERANLYVMSSRFEGFPNALLEALAYGVPAVSFDCLAGPSELIRHRENGLLAPLSGGVAALVSSLQSLMSSDVSRGKMGQAALGVRSTFNVSQIKKLWDKALGIDYGCDQN